MCRSVELWWRTVSEAAPTRDEHQLCLVLPAHYQRTRSHLHVSHTSVHLASHMKSDTVLLHILTVLHAVIPHQVSIINVVIIKTDSAERYYNENRHFTVHTAIPTNAATLSIHSKLITCFTALKHLQIGLCMPTSLTIHQHGSHLDIQYGATHVNITAHWRKDCLSVSVVNHVL